jgi:hypothetical protein
MIERVEGVVFRRTRDLLKIVREIQVGAGLSRSAPGSRCLFSEVPADHL